MSHGIIRALLLLMIISLTSVAQAIPVNLSIQGTVNATLGMNQFGLSVGDSVFANASFDDNLISAMGSSVVGFGTFGNAFGNPFTLTVGNTIFTSSNDIDFLNDEFPLLGFNNGNLSSIDFASDFFESGDLDFSGFNVGIENLIGAWDINTLSITPTASVPEPSSIFLLGLGMVGLIGVRRKQLI